MHADARAPRLLGLLRGADDSSLEREEGISDDEARERMLRSLGLPACENIENVNSWAQASVPCKR